MHLTVVDPVLRKNKFGWSISTKKLTISRVPSFGHLYSRSLHIEQKSLVQLLTLSNKQGIEWEPFSWQKKAPHRIV